MDKQKLEIKTDAIRAIEGRFGFEQGIIGEIEKTKMLIAHPDWVEFSANIPKPEIQKLEIAKPILPNVKKPETNVKQIGLSLAIGEYAEKGKKPG